MPLFFLLPVSLAQVSLSRLARSIARAKQEERGAIASERFPAPPQTPK
ncbi:hypothetical protein THAOC_22809, partial [Thalassiosira oceanica]